MEGSNKIVFKAKPMCDLLAIKIIKPTQATLLQEVQMPAYFALRNKQLIPGQDQLRKIIREDLLRLLA